ncbi:MAG: sulfite exporter TauE/SafE family protein [Ignavibacteria bacterium]|nr:sulfite exporter TauE/SafE family protein [Ignavibacteria bacterium]
MPDVSIIFYLLLFVVAFLYSSVGHGGASGYLALMALFSMPVAFMKSSSLLLNICVSLVAFVLFYRNVEFPWKLFIILTLVSIPCAFIGGMITTNSSHYKHILGALLLVPAVRFTGIFPEKSILKRKISIPIALIIGAIIGLLSSMIGIGGGILLSPLLILLGWATTKESSAVSALFIFLNSIAAVLGMHSRGVVFESNIFLFASIAVAGGLLGAYYGSKHRNPITLKRLLSAVLLIASIKLIFT